MDLRALTQLDGVRVLAELIRARWGVWVGLLALDGRAYPIAATTGTPPALCAHLKTRQDASGSCASSLRLWADRLKAGRLDPGVTQVACHGQLTGLLQPVLDDASRPVCALYITGFWRTATFPSQNRAAHKRLRELGLSDHTASTAAMPVLDPEAMAWVNDLSGRICAEVEATLSAHDLPAQDARPSDAAGRPNYSGIIGHSEPMMRLFHTLDRVVESDSTVLIQGENGTGKELIARAVHFNSRRRDDAFVVQNCSALNDNLLDSELFGHKRGSFTGAFGDKQGLFDLAHGGTFFLDEVGDMSPTLQVKLLRVLQEGTFIPVGDTVTRHVDVRIIAATNRDLRAMVKTGEFREDLYYRLNVINLVTPPLRERRSDIPLLVDHFLEQVTRAMGTPAKTLEPATLQYLLAYRWPGNIRELENEVERLVVLAGGEEHVGPGLLSRRIRASDAGVVPVATHTTDLHAAVETLERRMILESLRRTGWNKTRSAKELGVSRRNLIRKVERFGLEKHREA